MTNVKIIKNSSPKSFDRFVTDLTIEIERCGFAIIHPDKSDLTAFYRNQGVDLPVNYRHQMFQICKPEASGLSLNVNPERSLFVQKFISVYSKGEGTEIRILAYSKQLIADLLGHHEFDKGPTDDAFANRMENTFVKMNKMVEAVI